jgi:hypothetical protein
MKINEDGYTVDSLLKMAARYEADGQRILARVVFEDAMLLEDKRVKEDSRE